jgi:hypothetical protein
MIYGPTGPGVWDGSTFLPPLEAEGWWPPDNAEPPSGGPG